MWEKLKAQFENTFSFKFSRNQWKDIKRLLFEIHRRDNLKYEEILDKIKKDTSINKVGGRNKFFTIKKDLIAIRFPITSSYETIDTRNVFLTEIKKSLHTNLKPSKEFKPQHIFVEKGASPSYLLSKFKNKFPNLRIDELNYYADYLKNNKFSLSNLKKPIVFIVKERWDFIKPCPCTKYHLGCNYWIFNLGMGCPFDCSYCFLQAYSNFPGIVLPSNLDDFFTRFNDFYKKINRPLRIGTGEFCDSLALDDITDYSRQLIDFFRDKPLYFELKTKSDNIKNVLKNKPSPNIVISWSLNPQTIIDSEEKATASLQERIISAEKIQKKGFPLGFHFDPIIHFEGWHKLYKEVIDKLYHYLNPPFKWISLGTLRGSRNLKDIVEQRFPETNIFYGELFLGEDKKLRYPKLLKKEIYKNMIKWIKEYDKKTPVYLCMEDRDTWQIMDKRFNSSNQIEKYLLSKINQKLKI